MSDGHGDAVPWLLRPSTLEPEASWRRAAPPQVNRRALGQISGLKTVPEYEARKMMRVQGGRQRSPWRPPRSGRAAFPGTQAPPPCTSRPMPAFTASEVTLPSGVFRERNRRVPAGPDAATSTPTPEQMTPLCPLPALGYCFLPPLLRSVPRVACSARPRAQAAGLSWPGPPLHPAPLGAALLQPLSSARCLGRGRRGASNDGAHTGRTRFPRLGEVGGAASGP